jgi:hypothetical protein
LTVNIYFGRHASSFVKRKEVYDESSGLAKLADP